MARARRASSPVTGGRTTLAHGGDELHELAGVGVEEQLDVAAHRRHGRPAAAWCTNELPAWSPAWTMPADPNTSPRTS